MKITSKTVDDLNQVITVNVAAEDYEPARKKKLNDIQKRAEVPGFRKGKVPASLVAKWYGESALGDAVNNVVAEEVHKYIESKKLDIIGEPLPCEEKTEQEWKAGNDFTFKFDIALSPKVALELDKKDEIESYNISISAAEKKKLVEAYKAQQKDAPAEQVKSDEEIEKIAGEQLENEYRQASEFRFEKDVRDYCVKKAALAVPEKFLRRWLLVANEGKLTEEQIDKDFDGFLADYRWQLVMTELTKKYGIKIENDDLLNEAKNFARYQYAMYGIANAPEEMLDEFAKNILKDQSNVQRMVENVQARKVIAAVKEAVTVKNKKISFEKFRELK